MWRTTENDAPRHTKPATAAQGSVRETEVDNENCPSASQLVFEAGLVIAGALTVALAMQLLLGAMGIPDPV
jgi:hypothetical protein